MLAIDILRVEINVLTDGGTFSSEILFHDGLNIIRAENSSGKSTCVNAIAYALGLEAILGPNRKRPFPKSLYDEIYDSKINKKPYSVYSSFVQIKIKNRKGEIALLKRDIKGNDDKVVIITNNQSVDYFLGSSGKVGSAKSERGFHFWLTNFLGWSLPDVITFDGKEIKLYLECIFPLFFIEQKRGWSEIQANTPTYYGIQNVKKSATEFCLGIDSFEKNKKTIKLKKQIEEAKSEWNNIQTNAEGVADFNSVRINKLAEIEQSDEFPELRFSYLENNNYISIFDQEKSLKRFLDKVSQEISLNTVSDERVNSQLNMLGILRREFEEKSSAIGMGLLSISEINNKLKTLEYDHDQYQQLKRLRTVGSTVDLNLNTEKCPICDNDLFDTLGNKTSKRQPMTLDENIDFLKNQLDFFKSIKNRKESDVQKLKVEAKLLSAKITTEQEILENLKKDMSDINGSMRGLIREKIESEIKLREIEKLKISQDNFNKQLIRIYNTWKTASDSLRLAKKSGNLTDGELIIRKLQKLIQTNLNCFGFNPTAVHSVTVSNQTLRPEQEGYDIVAETSASDYIRIIWSYTLALLELGGREENVNHGGFIVFDEPRQHEASKISFSSLVKKSAESKLFNGQVIFATSLDKDTLITECQGLDVNLIFFDDFILTLNKS